ncbi:MAG: CTP synthase [Mycoplasmoidaceae bacterium]
MKTKIIVVTGGVYSSLGKGIIASSIGRILKENNFKISMQKLDPYLNVDPGTLSPYQHGEVFVTCDGAEADLDLGHYERFIDVNLSQEASITAGKIYSSVIEDERKGLYNGNTVQVVPHVTDKIISSINLIISKENLDFLIIEIGGTIGDIESLPFIEALRIYSGKYGIKNFMFVHASPIIELNANKERKTKPTQHSIKNLRSLGINPNMLVLRSSIFLKKEDIKKLSWTCGIEEKMIFLSKDCQYLYEIPDMLFNQGILKSIYDYFKIKNKPHSLTGWQNFLSSIDSSKLKVANIAIVGKYVELNDSYLSVIESLKLAGWKIGSDVNIELIDATKINEENYIEKLRSFTGILVPGGFGIRGIEGKILAAKYARENMVPFFGICLGMQAALISFARDILNKKDAHSTEFRENTKSPIFKLINENEENVGGTLRKGLKKILLNDKSCAFDIYKSNSVFERHRHRYAFNNNYSSEFEKKGLLFSGISDDNVSEIFEIKDHIFYMGVQFHPEFISRPSNPHPIFKYFLEKSSIEKA